MRWVIRLISTIAIDLHLAWWAMLWLGVAHSEDGRVPAFGYWTCVLLLFVLVTPVSSVLAARDIRKATE